jgi:hypothetical protein
MWEAVLIEPHHDPVLGGSAENMKAHYELTEMILYSMAAWPISGAVWLLAEDFFNVILPNVSIPCET